MSRVWFTADQHYCHENIIKYCNRPFSNAHEMDEVMIENHNSVVKNNDDVYFLGDFCFRGNNRNAVDILSRLNGNKFIVRGNHDQVLRDCHVAEQFKWIKDYYELKVYDEEIRKNRLVVLMHYAMRVWHNSHFGSFMCFGHSHGVLPDDPDALSIDVGVDAIAQRRSTDGALYPKDFIPISYEEVRSIMKAKSFVPIRRNE